MWINNNWNWISSFNLNYFPSASGQRSYLATVDPYLVKSDHRPSLASHQIGLLRSHPCQRTRRCFWSQFSTTRYWLKISWWNFKPCWANCRRRWGWRCSLSLWIEWMSCRWCGRKRRWGWRCSLSLVIKWVSCRWCGRRRRKWGWRCSLSLGIEWVSCRSCGRRERWGWRCSPN